MQSDSGTLPRPRLLPVILGGLLLLTLIACDRDLQVHRELLPPTMTNRMEAVVTVPRGGRLDLEWGWNQAQPDQTSDVLEVWLHTEEGRGELLEAVPFNQEDETNTLSLDLARWQGQRVLVRGATRVGPAAPLWKRATVSGWGPPPEEPEPAWAEEDRPPDVLVYLIDTLRPDVLGLYGGDVPTPNLDRIAAEGVVYDNAYSSTSWTRPAIASLFSGLSIDAHKVATEGEALPEEVLTLAERFRLRGYQTLAIYSNLHVTDIWHFDQGFERYALPPVPPAPGKDRLLDPEVTYDNIAAEAVNALVVQNLERHRDPQRPLFLYVHVVDPHMPYRPPRWVLEEDRPDLVVNPWLMQSINQRETSPEVVGDLFKHYRGAVAYTDVAFGELVESIRPWVDLDETVTVILSDHGEAFLEHGLVGHKSWIYEEQIRIPLVLRGPGVPRGVRVPDVVSIVDVLPTMLELSGGRAASPLQGAPLPLDAAPRPAERPVVAEHIHGIALRKGPWKLVHRIEAGTTGLFDVDSDPLEKQDVLQSRPEVGDDLERDVRRWRAACRQNGSHAYKVSQDMVPESILNELKALGYL